MTNLFCAGRKVFKTKFQRITYCSSCDKTSSVGFSFTGGGLCAKKHERTSITYGHIFTSTSRFNFLNTHAQSSCYITWLVLINILVCFFSFIYFPKSHFSQALTGSVTVAERSRFLRLLRNSAISAARLSAFSFSMSPSNF